MCRTYSKLLTGLQTKKPSLRPGAGIPGAAAGETPKCSVSGPKSPESSPRRLPLSKLPSDGDCDFGQVVRSLLALQPLTKTTQPIPIKGSSISLAVARSLQQRPPPRPRV